MNGIWYYSRDGSHREGPVTEECLGRMIREGGLPPEALVWSPELPGWEQVRRVLGRAPEPPPLPGVAAEPVSLAEVIPELPRPATTARVLDAVLAEPESAPLPPEGDDLSPRKIHVRGRVVLLGTGSVVLGVLSVLVGVLALTGVEDGIQLVTSLFLIAAGCLWAFLGCRLMRRTVSMMLTRQGIVRKATYGSALIPWEDIEKIGVMHLFGVIPLVGVRLKTYDNYLANMSPEVAEGMLQMFRYVRFLSGVGILPGGPPQLLKLWSKASGTDLDKEFEGLDKIRDVAQLLARNREFCGYDVCFDWTARDRPARPFAALLERYRLRYARRTHDEQRQGDGPIRVP